MKLVLLIIITLSLGLSSSCVSKKKMVYFQSEKADSTSYNYPNFELKYKVGDFLSINVFAGNEELVTLFNKPPIIGENISGSYFNDNALTTGYKIDLDSTINFPFIGKIKAAGKTKLELTDDLEEILTGYIQDPTVTINLRNFKITILGDVSMPGTFNVTNERITLLEALGVARDIQITGRRKNILVIREEGSKIKKYRVDLTSEEELFNSPVYFLQQNDIVYVEPNQTKLNNSQYSPVYSILISVTSLIITVAVLVTSN